MIKLIPVSKDYLWGGSTLKTLFNKQSASSIIAESWEASVHPDGESTVSGGGTFKEYLLNKPNAVSKNGGEFPVLIKYIDAAKNLSVQVHPDDDFARRVEGDNGKTEMWYVIKAEKGAGIYCGFKRDTKKEEFIKKVQDGTVEELLNFIPLKEGDCFLITAGTVHAIGAGCVICEIQQSSNVTYRVFDYNRVGADGKPRALHVEKASQVIDYNKFTDKTHSGEYKRVEGGKLRLLTKCKYFNCRELIINGTYAEQNDSSFTAVNFISGSGKINGEEFKAGDTFFVDCGEAVTYCGNFKAVLTTL